MQTRILGFAQGEPILPAPPGMAPASAVFRKASTGRLVFCVVFLPFLHPFKEFPQLSDHGVGAIGGVLGLPL